jgi:hypothetical protein
MTIQDMKEETNKDMETLKIISSISQINITIKSLGTEWSKLKTEYQEQKTK